MGIPVLILGESGSGKSTSLRNFDPNEILIFNVAGKPLPFRKKMLNATTADYSRIINTIKKADLKTYAIDDSQYLMAFELFDKAKDTGYGKFTDIAIHFKNLIDTIVKDTPNDVIVYLLHHIDTYDNSKIRAKTVGKMLDNQLTLEGLFSIVLLCEISGGEHFFNTTSDGYSTAKSPIEMFPPKIPNDLKAVDTAIRDYYQINSSKKVKGDITDEQTR